MTDAAMPPKGAQRIHSDAQLASAIGAIQSPKTPVRTKNLLIREALRHLANRKLRTEFEDGHASTSLFWFTHEI